VRRLAPLLVAVAVIVLAILFINRTPTTSSPVAASRDGGAGTTRPSWTSPRPATANSTASDGGAVGNSVSTAPGTVVVRGAWGGQPGEFGRRRDPESNPEAPMAVAAGAGDQLAVVDQVNRRVQRFQGGKLVGTLNVGGDTIQDLAVTRDGRTLLLDRLADRNVQVYGVDGKLENELGLVGPGITEGGAVTGLFHDDRGVYVEREHGKLIRIADADGKTTSEREELPGRPTRDGRLYISAALGDRPRGQLAVRAFDRTTRELAWAAPVQLAAPILHILLLDSDTQGRIYVAAATGREGTTAPFKIVDEAIEAVQLGPGGDVRGYLRLPPLTTADETFRPLTVDDAGNLFVMVPTEAGLVVTRYQFP
jgi:hypothetical protein